MSLAEILKALIDDGLSEQEIADIVETSQPTIHRIKTGLDTRYSIGKKIEALYQQRLGKDTNSSEIR